jgi:flagellar hook protein FlgE
MSLFGALFSGVSGLNANAHAMGVISDNIANVNTVGYKVTNARFSTLVTESATSTRYSPGGVISKPLTDFNRQGLLQASSSATDIAIAGNGLFVVNELAKPTASSGQYMFTRAGSFTPDKNGDLRNAAGLYLQGWAVDANGNIPANRSDLTALSTVNVSGLTGTAEATTTLALKANLQSSQALTFTGPQDTTSSFSIASTAKLSDGAGGGTITGLLDGDSFKIGDGSTDYGTFVFRNTPAAGEFSTLAELKALIDATTELSASIGGTANDATLTVTGLDQGKNLVITDVVNGAGTDLFGGASPITTTTTYDATVSAKNMASGTVKADFQRSVGIFDSKGGARTVTFSFVKSGTPNQWYTEVHIQPAGDATVVSPLVDGQVATGMVAFNNDGTFNTATTTLASSITIAWAPILGLQNSTIALDLGTNGQSNGMTQFDAPSNLVSSNVNGALFGTLTGVAIGEDGFVTAQFNNGTQRNIFKVAVATFPNPSGLANKTGNAYVPTDRAGDFNLLEPGLGGSGSIVSSALEASTVDIAQEFTNMIVTQRAYSASSRIITTTDEMLDELIRIIR